MSENKPVAVLSRREVEKRTTLARTTIYRKIKANTFPKQIQVSDNRVGWPESEIDRYLANPMGYRTPEATA
ncbi:AlpA family transcriptional regulator [Marinomonas sp. CT5]|uniref:helix-turn-helix transcriptional regulator n=1 Tax=Marinomonas sp. CT5 TaxID=2066133 RepID=UPI001BB08471|nr:AlpA family phage regulatory protein [Marinomonas sp. CT5]QUX96646.1 AlpA family transcriptional regulator [Marinomonas sp. CT5]